MLKNFRTFHIAVEYYHAVKTLKLNRNLKDQLERASSSISLNLAEGQGKRTNKDKRKIFHIAFGSIKECEAILKLALIEDTKLLELQDKLAAHIYKLTKHYEGG